MAATVRTLLTSLALILFAQLAAADLEQVKEAIFDDCSVARREFSALDPNARAPLLEYLSRVVALDLQAPEAAAAFAILAPPPGVNDSIRPGPGQSHELAPTTLWRAMDAKRELRAKRCALELLQIAGAAALRIVPSLAATYQKAGLSDEVGVAIEDAVVSIAEQAHLQSLSLNDAEFDALIPHLVGAHPVLARHLITEYLVVALPRIILTLVRPQSELSEQLPSQQLLDTLRSLDPDGARTLRAFIELAPSLPRDGAQTVAQHLPFPTTQQLPPLLPQLATLAIGTESAPIFLPLLIRACEELGTLPPEVAATVAPATAIVTDARYTPPQLRCLVRSIPEFAATVGGLALSSDAHEAHRGLELLPAAVTALPPSQRSALFSHLRGVATRGGDLQQLALTHLALFPERRAEALSTLAQLLKPAEIATAPSSELHTSAFATLAAVLGVPVSPAADPTKPTSRPSDGARFVAAVVAALKRSEPPHAAVAALATALITPSADLIPLISADAPERSRIVLQLFDAPKKGSAELAVKLAPLVKLPVLQREVHATLRRYGMAMLAPLRKLLASLSGEARLGALALIVAVGQPSKSEFNEVVATLSEANCTLFETFTSTALTLLARADLPAPARAAMTARGERCLPHGDAIAVRAWLEAPTTVADGLAPRMVEWLSDPALKPPTRAVLLEFAAAEARSEEVRERVVQWLLEHGSAAEKSAAIVQLQRAESAELRAALRSVAGADGAPESLRVAAQGALARSGDTEFEWPELLDAVLELAGTGDVSAAQLTVITSLPPALVLREIGPALESSSSMQVVGACRIAAALGERAAPVVSRIWQLRERRAPEIRYAAVLALLEINPFTPELQEHVRLLLGNRYFSQALARPIQWHKAVAVVDLDTSSFGTLRTVHLERLLISERLLVSGAVPVLGEVPIPANLLSSERSAGKVTAVATVKISEASPTSGTMK